MKKRVALIPLVVGIVALVAAAAIVWSNLSGRPFFGGSVLASTGGAAAPPVSRSPGNAPGPASGPGASGPRQNRTQTHPVETQTAAMGTLRSVVKLTGEVTAATRVNVFPEVAGKVDRIAVGIGSRIQPQTTLLTVDPSRPGTRYEPSPVRSPIAGTVIDILVERGESVGTATPAVVVATIDNLEVSVRLPERYASIVTARSTATVSFDALGGRSIEARVKRLQPVIDPTSRSKEVVFAITEGTPGIEPGMFASVELVSQRIDGIIVPFETIVQEAGSNYLYVVEGGKAVRRQVSIGLLAGEMVEVRQGLTAGEAVITTGQSFLQDGSPVSVVRQTAGRIETDQTRQ